MSDLIQDALPLMEQLNPMQANVAKKHGIPMFKGILYENITDDYGNTILKKVNENTVVIGGAVLALEHLCNATSSWKPATLNTIYNVNAAVTGDNAKSFISLFGVGIGGSALTFGNVLTPDVKQRDVMSLIPLRTGASITGTDADKYFFRKDNGGGTYNWYLKEFNATPTIKSLWKDSAVSGVDGTEILEEIYNSERTEGVESLMEFSLKLNTSDVREYFESIGELNMARYNSIGLFTGQKVQISTGYYDYANVRLFSTVNINNRSVSLASESSYTYRVYSLV
jgi:hypothetical protein